MDTKASVDQMAVTENISSKKIEKLDKKSAAMETEDMVPLSSLPLMRNNDNDNDNGGFDLSPITPDSNKESVDLMSGFTSPLTFISSPPPSTGFCMNEEEDADSPSTPTDGVFDPFAPGPDNLMLAPLSMKYLEESRSFVARKLSFNSLLTKNDCEGVSESCFEYDVLLLEDVYDFLLEVIIRKQAEDFIGEISAVDDVELKTPPSPPPPCLTGIAHSCPAAPMKHVKKSRNIDLSLCRKLEFDVSV